MGVSDFLRLTLIGVRFGQDGAETVIPSRPWITRLGSIECVGGDVDSDGSWVTLRNDGPLVSPPLFHHVSESPSEVFRLIREAEGFVVGSESVPLVEGG